MAELTDAQKVLRNDTGKRIAAAIEALGGTPPISLGMTGATPGQVPVINTVDANGAPTSYRPGAGGGGGTADALPLAGGTMEGAINMDGNKVSNLPTPTATGDAVPKSYADEKYTKPSGGIPQTDLAQTVQNKLDSTVVVSDTQPTATENKLWVDTDAGSGSAYQIPTVAEMEAADAQTAAEIGIVITGKRPSMAVSAGQYVIVRNSTISGITDGLYKANSALSPSTDVTAANLTSVGGGGLNSLGAHIADNFAPFNQLYVTGYSTYRMALPSLSGHFVFIVGSSLSRSAILYIVVQSSGSVAVEEIQKGTNFTYTADTNELTFGNGATYAIYIKEIPIRGDPITVEPVS